VVKGILNDYWWENDPSLLSRCGTQADEPRSKRRILRQKKGFLIMANIQSRSTRPKANSKRRILIVDDEPSIVRLLAEVLRQEGYFCLGCQSGQEAMRLMDTRGFDVVLCDIHMPGMSGLELLRFVREKHPGLASVMVTGEGDVRIGIQAMKEGADDYLLKPLIFEAVLLSIKQVLERKRLEAELENYRLHLEKMVDQRTVQLRGAICRIEQNYDETLQALAAALDLRDSETAGHSGRVMAYTLEIAKAAGCAKEQLNTIARGALLHDIGKIGVPDAILMKPGPLTEEEWPLMKAHVGVGYWLLSRIAFLEDAAEIVLAHHERFDGKGYAQGLQGGMIPLGARIFAVADSLDAITSDRPYRRALPFVVAREEIVRQSGKQFDPAVVSAFLAIDESTWHELRAQKGAVQSSHSEPWLHMPPEQIAQALLQIQSGV
jgi:response regulator RpfG family c-di-GMP phosphodiesterase